MTKTLKTKPARRVHFSANTLRPARDATEVRLDPLERMFVSKLAEFMERPEMVSYLVQLAHKLQTQQALTRAKVRDTMQGVRSAAKPPYNIGQISCNSVESLEEELHRRVNASQIAHRALRQLEQQTAALNLDSTLREDNGLPTCEECSKQRGFPCYSRFRDTGRAARSNGGKANNTKCYCKLCGDMKCA